MTPYGSHFIGERTSNKENISLKKEIGEHNDRECYLVCDFNFYEFRKKPVLARHLSHPPPAAYINTRQHTNLLGVHDSLESKKGNIFRRRTLLFPSLTLYFL